MTRPIEKFKCKWCDLVQLVDFYSPHCIGCGQVGNLYLRPNGEWSAEYIYRVREVYDVPDGWLLDGVLERIQALEDWFRTRGVLLSDEKEEYRDLLRLRKAYNLLARVFDV